MWLGEETKPHSCVRRFDRFEVFAGSLHGVDKEGKGFSVVERMHRSISCLLAPFNRNYRTAIIARNHFLDAAHERADPTRTWLLGVLFTFFKQDC